MLQRSPAWLKDFIGFLVGLAALIGAVIFLIVDSRDEPERLYSAAGILVFVFLGFVLSANPAQIRWRHVCWGLGIQFTMGLLVLRWETGRNIFQCIGDKANTFLGFSDSGSSFVYGYLVTGKLENVTETYSNTTMTIDIGYGLFAFKTLSLIYFFSFVVAILFYWGALQWFVMKMGWLLSITIGTTAAESLSTSANVFLGQTEAPLLIKPFLPIMTNSEIHAVMTGGFATIAGTVLGAFINFGIEADKLIAASVMAAPAALAISKLLYPETEKSKTTFADITIVKGPESNVLDAAAQGASSAVMLILNIAASLIAFLAFVAFLDAVIGWFGDLAGASDLSFQYFLSKLFIPVAYILGVPNDDVETVARLIGIKTVINEFVAYQELGELKDTLSPRAVVIATYALCGFANFGSIGIQLSVLSAMAPERKQDMAQIIPRAFVAGILTTLTNACVAGSLISTSV